MEPASTIIERLGGAVTVSKITGTGMTAPYRWQYPRTRGGTDGLIPQKHHPTLLAYADAHGVPLSAADFLPQRDELLGAPDRLPRPSPGAPPPGEVRAIRTGKSCHHNGNAVPSLPGHVLHALDLVIIRAHELRMAGRTKRAVALLRRAADGIEAKHAAAGMHGLADLFAAHPPQCKRTSAKAVS